MGNHRVYKAECIHTLGTPESERMKVTALNLFPPTTPPLTQELCLLIATQSLREEGKGEKGKNAINGVHD
jgi:hypothetical protein